MLYGIIGAIIGYLVFGGRLSGLILGFLIGWNIDNFTRKSTVTNDNRRNYFIDNLLVLFACVMKADGRVTKMEVSYVRGFLETNFGLEESNKGMLKLRDILKEDNINLSETCFDINRTLNYAQKLELLHTLFRISSLDNNISKSELNVIHQVASYMRISAWDFGTIQAMYYSSQQSGYNYGGYAGNQQQPSKAQIDNAYTILQVSPSATNEEIKKSYKKLVVKYHPDKVASLGEDIQKQANEKFQQINAAYELIKKERQII